MRIDCICACVNYGDFLAQTLPWNNGLFDRLLVVTDTKDRETVDVCRQYGVECHRTDSFYKDGAQFSKANAVNEAMDILRPQDWCLILDADVVLPTSFRALLERMARQMEIDGKCVYGVDRLMIKDWKTWQDFAPTLRKIDAYFVPIHLPVGTRFAAVARDGWVPIGFFQLWNPRVSGIDRYPEGKDAADSDVVFGALWPRNRRVLIPDFVAVHLETEAAIFGQNWRGRKTPRFEAPPSDSPMAPRRQPTQVQR